MLKPSKVHITYMKRDFTKVFQIVLNKFVNIKVKESLEI